MYVYSPGIRWYNQLPYLDNTSHQTRVGDKEVIEELKKAVKQVLSRKSAVLGKGESQTKLAMVLPIIEALGYDIWNPNEVCAEFSADVPLKKNGQPEKVDYAILDEEEQPQIFIECKSVDEKLDGHEGQLRRYFNSTPSVGLAILTNGIEYRLFTDTNESNILDKQPFFVCKFESSDPGLDILSRFRKGIYSAETIQDFATELVYTDKIFRFLSKELDVGEGELSDLTLRWILSSEVYDGNRITASVVERFKPIAKDAIQRVFKRVVSRSIIAINSGSSEVVEDTETTELQKIEIETDDDIRKSEAVVDAELEAYLIIKEFFDASLSGSKIYDPSSKSELEVSIGYRETATYFNVFFNKTSWWNMRLFFDAKRKYIDFDVPYAIGSKACSDDFEHIGKKNNQLTRVYIENSNDMKKLENLIIVSFEKTISDRASLKLKHNTADESNLEKVSIPEV